MPEYPTVRTRTHLGHELANRFLQVVDALAHLVNTANDCLRHTLKLPLLEPHKDSERACLRLAAATLSYHFSEKTLHL